jgi:anti-sigma factor ChrR (cupin superfamily)
MKINAEFDQRVVVHSADLEWIKSPIKGVERRPLDRVGKEVARATTIVRYAPGSEFSPHVHSGGEEFIVIDGVFQDEHGDFPAGSYIRNPPESSHTPGSEAGCIIFVKLWQYEMEDRTHIRLRTDHMHAIPHRDMPGITVTPLYKDNIEEVSMLYLEPDSKLSLDLPQGAEILVLEGEISEGEDVLKRHSWLRVPPDGDLNAISGSKGTRIWLKTGHLSKINVDAQITRANNA